MKWKWKLFLMFLQTISNHLLQFTPTILGKLQVISIIIPDQTKKKMEMSIKLKGMMLWNNLPTSLVKGKLKLGRKWFIKAAKNVSWFYNDSCVKALFCYSNVVLLFSNCSCSNLLKYYNFYKIFVLLWLLIFSWFSSHLCVRLCLLCEAADLMNSPDSTWVRSMVFFRYLSWEM